MKNKLFYLLFLFGVLLLAGQVKAQDAIERSSEKTKIGGKEYYMHHVKQGQTLYGISKAYNVTIEEIEALNPEVKDGLKAGHVIGIPVRSNPEEIKEEPRHVTVKPKHEPKQEPKNEPKPEPVVEKPKPEPVIVEPEPEPVVVEPEPVVVEPEPDPEPVIVEPEPEPEPVVIEPEPEPEPIAEHDSDHKNFFDGKARIVQRGEDLYDIAKEYGIDLAELKYSNPGLTDEPAPGTRIVIPKVANENDYIMHSCQRNERVSSLLKRWKVDENIFRSKNVSVGSHVFVNQVVLIPIRRITDFYWMGQTEGEVVEEVENPVIEDPKEEPKYNFDFDLGDIPDCVAAPENALKRYHVALMVPLYLSEIGSVEVSKDNAEKAKKARSLSFLQFYEGFMMAAEAMEKQGMKLDLTVIDVTDKVSTAESALTQIEDMDLDLIVGPFFSKSFSVVEEFAKAHGITVVNPLSTRKSVIEDSPNVVKVKAGDMGMILTISNLVKNHYSDANVFIVSREKEADTAFLSQLEHHLNMAINEEVRVTGDEFLQFARNESARMEMGSRMVPTIDVEGQVYSTGDFQSGASNEIVLSNTVKRYPYSEIAQVKTLLSGVRDNVIVAYGEDNVFATQMLNSLTKSADRFPITLICAPDWQKHEKLLVENLLKMNAIYVSDGFVDYNSEAAKRFVLRFRKKYSVDPEQYAFEGYDLGCYFLNALMQYGSDDLIGCLHCYQASLLCSNYRFYYKNYLNAAGNEGKENLYWSIYQYDKEDIQLVPVDPFKKIEDEE